MKKSLAALRLDYVDMYLMHWPVAVKVSADWVLRDRNVMVNYLHLFMTLLLVVVRKSSDVYVSRVVSIVLLIGPVNGSLD